MVKFKNNSKYKYIKDIKKILNDELLLPSIKSKNFNKLYELLMVSAYTPETIGEFTKFLYNSTKIDLLNYLDEVPDFFLTQTDLIEINIPNHITILNDYCFAFTQELKKVTLPPNLKTIGVSSFINCYALEEIILPKTLEEIASRAFEHCVDLDKINYVGTFEDFLQIKGNLNLASEGRIITCTDARIKFNYPQGKWVDIDN